ncbi:glycosyltransferase family 2 protein [Paenibacillus oryzisoli]|uniref:Glycosyl transferase family 2 n=1 Tax=Paenibacillus oryzisoli TaxID=1850517 RepID=A0A198A7U1_9BACL|nr:glycosyltransferase [Paenibacillus oryzisoli]OAS17212.1 glycosyl transferase family 2 [Paenibacillus oryzisoli]
MSTKVSVIIPVYNAEKYLVPCIESLISQTLEECEFIFINDGSQDGSAGIIESFAKLDSRIKLIHQNNQGVSMARNHGLRLASGEYVGFVDADDYVEKDMFETLYWTAKEEDYDVVISIFETEIAGSKVITTYPFPTDTKLARGFIEQEIITYLLKSDQMNTVWNKLYKRTLIFDHGVEFPQNMPLGEDGYFNMSFFSHAQLVISKSYRGYHYREVAGSATRNILEKDYFKRALEVYLQDVPKVEDIIGNQHKVKQLKSTKLMRSVMANIHVYLNPTHEISFHQRFRYVTNMVKHPIVSEALPLFCEQEYDNLGRYEKLMTYLIQKKSIAGLYFCTKYSKLKSKSI